jgi:hypothetical protein
VLGDELEDGATACHARALIIATFVGSPEQGAFVIKQSRNTKLPSGFSRRCLREYSDGVATSLTTTASVVLVVVCPVIYAIWGKWWLVPIFNTNPVSSL